MGPDTGGRHPRTFRAELGAIWHPRAVTRRLALVLLLVGCAGAQRGREAEEDGGADLGIDLGPPDLGPPPDHGIDLGPPPLARPSAGPGLALAGESSCALREGLVRCWGANRFGALGDPTLAVGHRIRRASPTVVEGLNDPVRIAAGAFHVCALEAAGTVRCWGHGGWGQLGDGDGEDRRAPVAVAGLEDAVAIAAGGGHSCALRANAEVVCWGRNHMGQLGDATTDRRLEPVPVPIDRVLEVVVGGNHGCARTESGEVLCWGENLEGQLGDGSRSEPRGFRSEPAPVEGLGEVLGLASGWAHVCARTTEGVRCWGRNDSYQLAARGRGSANEAILEPRAMTGVEDASALALGARYSCAIVSVSEADAGAPRPELRCAGIDHRGQLGNGSRRMRRTMEPVPLEGVVEVAAGVQHTCAITTDGAVWCWGDDRQDQVGQGRHRLVATPHRVLPP